MSLALLMDFLLAILLGSTCIYCVVLNRRLKTLKDGQADLQSAITVFDSATKRAQETLERLDANGVGRSRDLELEMAKANALAAELSVMVSAGDSIAGRIERAMGEVRAIGGRRKAAPDKVGAVCMTASQARPRFVPVLILILAVLALLRAGNVWLGFNSATAEAAPDDAVVSSTANPVAQTSLIETPSEAERRLFNQLAARREALDAREAELDTREKLLEAAETSVDRKLAALEEKKAELTELLAERTEQENEEYEALSSAYERMKPRDAARIFEVLDDDILVPVAAGMRTQAISGVLAEMDPEKARQLTKKLAARSAMSGNAGQ